MNISIRKTLSRSLSIASAICILLEANAGSSEDDYYPMYTVPSPEGVLLEVGGLAALPGGRLAVCTRRGKVWIISNPADLSLGTPPVFKLFAEGLHEPLGLLYHDNALYAAQRGELTKLIDTDGDDIADIYETVAAWPSSAHYHEYSFGPKLAADGSFFVTANVAFGDQEWWRGESRVPWRGWTLKIHPNGTIEPWATGMRSPAGLGMYEDELFYTDNQGDWVGSGGIWHLTKGSFTSHPAGLRWSDHPDSPVSLTYDQFHARIDERRTFENGRSIMPRNIQNEKSPTLLPELKTEFPEIQLPAVILPHGILGVSNSEIVVDQSSGNFGPFEGQLFVGDQGQSKIMRVSMEKINGDYQGVAFDFRKGFQSGVMRMAWGNNGMLFAGETSRGWGSAGDADYGLQFIRWSGKVPFEMTTVRAKADGFEIEFTKPVDRSSALDLSSYSGRSYTYKYHSVYGSPQIDFQDLDIQGVTLSEDGLKARIVVGNLRPHYVHELHLRGVLAKSNSETLLHSSAYYTLNAIPAGTKLNTNQLSTRRSVLDSDSEYVFDSENATAEDEFKIQALLTKNTCVACHNEETQVVGPAFKDISKRNYSSEEIVELIYNPKPENWPNFPTPMPPMPQVSKHEALQIAKWIRSLTEKNDAPIVP